MIFLKDKYRIVLDKRNVTTILITVLPVLFFIFCDLNYVTDNGKLVLYQTPILIIVVSIITIDMLPNKVNPFHIDCLITAKVDEKQTEAVFNIFKNIINLVLCEILHYPNILELRIKDINIGQLKNVTLMIRAIGSVEFDKRSVDLLISVYNNDLAIPLVSISMLITSDIQDILDSITVTKNLNQWKDLIVLAKTVEYYLINHQYKGAIKNEERGF